MLFEGSIVFFDMAEIFVHIQAVMCDLDDTAGNVGAMVGNTFQIVEQIGQHKAQLDGASFFCKRSI